MPGEPPFKRSSADLPLIVEAEPIDDGMVGSGPEDAGRGVAALGAWRKRADFDETEAHGEELARHARVLVEAGGHAERVGKVEAEQRLGKARIVGLVGTRKEPELEALDGDVMREFGVEREE